MFCVKIHPLIRYISNDYLAHFQWNFWAKSIQRNLFHYEFFFAKSCRSWTTNPRNQLECICYIRQMYINFEYGYSGIFKGCTLTADNYKYVSLNMKIILSCFRFKVFLDFSWCEFLEARITKSDIKWFDEPWWRATKFYYFSMLRKSIFLDIRIQLKNQANLIYSMSFGQNRTESYRIVCTVRFKTNINNIFEWFINGIYYNVQ